MNLVWKHFCLAVISAVILALAINIFSATAQDKTDLAPVYGYKIVNAYPHDRTSFTQGLFFENGYLYEGTGLYGQSALRKVDLKTGKVLKSRSLPARFFGEGVTEWKDKIIQLTWKEGIGFVYGEKSFGLIREFSYSTEGWGLTHDDKRLIMSDGTANLYFLSPETFRQVGQVVVRYGGAPVTNLNELEYVKGKIYANVWLTDRIAIISPETGIVEAWIDLSGLRREKGLSTEGDVLNGIAYDSEQDRLFVTGKLWPKVFEIKIVP